MLRDYRLLGAILVSLGYQRRVIARMAFADRLTMVNWWTDVLEAYDAAL